MATIDENVGGYGESTDNEEFVDTNGGVPEMTFEPPEPSSSLPELTVTEVAEKPHDEIDTEVDQVRIAEPPETLDPVAASEEIMNEIKLSAPPTPEPLSTLAAQRTRTDSVSTVATTATTRTFAHSSLLFVVKAFELIAASKDARKSKELGTAVEKALAAIRGEAIHDQLSPELLFEPLRLAAASPDPKVVTTSLDCIGNLISYSYFSLPPQGTDEHDGPPLIERAIDTICDCFQSEATPVETQLQIVKSLLSAILNDKIVVHGAGLLKAVRMTYNIFLLSKSSANQNVAQGALTQMVGTVFERVKTRLELKEARLAVSQPEQERADSEDGSQVYSPTYDQQFKQEHRNGDPDMDETETVSSMPSDIPAETHETPKITLQTFENQQSFDDAKITEAAPTLVTRLRNRRYGSRTVSGQDLPVNGAAAADAAAAEDEEDEIFIRDAYLVFRAMCRLTTKPLPMEHALDVKSQGMRSKLISLHIIYTILDNHPTAFTSPYSTIRNSSTDEPTSFVQAIKQYLCLSLSRNGASSVKPVFEVSCEIFWLMIKLLRVSLKKEIEVFLKEIYFTTLEKRAAPAWQKTLILKMFSRLASESRALVEVYLNYDCDPTAADNMFERIVEHLSKISSTPVVTTPVQQTAYLEYVTKQGAAPTTDWHHRSLPPSLATASLHTQSDSELGFPTELIMKNESLVVLVEMLRSLVTWAQGMAATDNNLESTSSLPRITGGESRNSFDRGILASPSPRIGNDSPMTLSTPAAEDDPGQLDRDKQRKTAMASAIRQFNFKPKRGIKALIKDGFIPSEAPEDVARFLLGNDLINKAALGEFLGEGDEENIKIMHSFVELMEFRQTRFVDALRQFLQSFRLPGEAQKIDRFMLKFAERYILGNPNAFANADTAYVLAYSVIMLNTDQHSAKIKGRRMTPEDFIKNNRGINDNADLPDDYLRGIYAEIASNEIVLNTERETAANLGQLPQPTAGLAATLGQVVVNAGRDAKREEYAQTEELANRTEQLYKNLLRSQRKGAKANTPRFIAASSFKHVGPMFQVAWMSFLTALSGAAQVATTMETVRLCMEGQKLAIRIACLFDLADPRQAFIQSLSRFSSLYNLSEMKAKNLEALKVLLEIAITEGNNLNDSWREILTCVSQLDRFQLISTGVDEGVVPDVMRRNAQDRVAPSKRASKSKVRQSRGLNSSISFQADIAEETRSVDIIRSMDRIFTNTANLSGDAILHFVRALAQVSWQEIENSGQKESPRTYSLQKLVEVSAYNMTRVRFQWANIWQILGAHFNQVGCHTNTHVVYFALDSLRQLSMKFLEIEELPGFKFQKDFLKPFEHIIGNTTVVAVKDMVLRCLIQMIQAKGANIRSGWRTMFGVFTVAAHEPYENIVNLAYDHVTQIYNDRFGVVISQGAFADLIVCLTQFSKNQKFQRKALQAIEAMKASIQKMLRTPECPLSARRPSQGDSAHTHLAPSAATQSQEEQYWFPVLFAFHDVLMTGEDLEVRSRALNYLFETLMSYGGDFPLDFWDTLWRQLLYPIFMVLRSKSEMSKVVNHEELSVWLSTTMIQALRNMITLFTHFFHSLEYMLDRFLDLLILCICQENDTLARIGSNCLQQLILQNVTKFNAEDWHKIVNAFVELFTRTEATALFAAATSSSFASRTMSINGSEAKTPSTEPESLDSLSLSTPSAETPMTEISEPNIGLGISNSQRQRDDWGSMGPAKNESDQTSIDGDSASRSTDANRSPTRPSAEELESYRPPAISQQSTPVPVTAARRQYFNRIITQCVLTLLMIETVNDLFSNDEVYAQIPSPELLRLMAILKKSYQFARRFNGDRDLRTRLFKEGFMKQPPNLLKQESGAAATYVAILLRMYHDPNPARVGSRAATEDALVPLCADILRNYLELDDETQARNILTWRPVVVDVLDGYVGFDSSEFNKYIPTFAPLVVGLLGREMTAEVQIALQKVVGKMFESGMGIDCRQAIAQSLEGRRSRRESRTR